MIILNCLRKKNATGNDIALINYDNIILYTILYILNDLKMNKNM